MADRFTLRNFDARPLRVPLSVLGVAFIGASFLVTHGWDLHSYWEVDPSDPYAGIDTLNEFAVFRYAPPMALVGAPLRFLPFEVVAIGWLALQLAALWYVARGWALAMVLFPPVWLDIVYGNINILLGAMIVAGLRHPAAWVFGLLTKVTPGIGLLWFAARREWRPLLIAGGTLLVIVAGSVAIQGVDVWVDWFESLNASRQMPIPFDALPIPLLPRLVLAAVLIAWGALGSRTWVLPVGVVIAMPVIWVISLTPLIALWPRDRLETADEALMAPTHPDSGRSGAREAPAN